jgi:hypothetical protein
VAHIVLVIICVECLGHLVPLGVLNHLLQTAIVGGDVHPQLAVILADLELLQFLYPDRDV